MKSKIEITLLSVCMGMLFPITLSSTNPFSPTAMFNSELTLEDEQEHTMPDEYSDFPRQESEILNRLIDKMLNAPLLKALGIGICKDEVKDYGEHINDYYIYTNCEHWDYMIQFGSCKFVSFCHKILKIQMVRDLLYDFLSDAVCDFCRQYPADFKSGVISAIEESMGIVSDLGNHTYRKTVDEYGYDVLWVDGKEFIVWNESVVRGFWIRRMINDDFAPEVLHDYLTRLLGDVQSVDVKGNPQIFRRININDDLTYCKAATGNYYIVNKTGAILCPYDSEWRRYEPTSIQCFKGEGSRLYKITDYGNYIIIDTDGQIIAKE